MKQTTTIWKIPTTDFTHSEMAELNGVTNQKVWQEYSRLRAEGFIISAGVRKGTGKPTGVWKVADGHEIITDVTFLAIQSASRVHRVQKPAKLVVLKDVVEMDKTIEEKSNFIKLAEAIMEIPSLPKVNPTAAPFEVEENGPAENTGGETIVEEKPIVQNLNTNEVIEVDYKCSICGTKCLAQNDNTGVMVWCPSKAEACYPHENPYGHGNNVKNAWETLCQKYKKS